MILKFFTVLFVGLVYILCASRSEAAVLFEDDFNNDTSKWSVQSGNWTIQDGKYGAFSSGVANYNKTQAILDIVEENYTVELDIFPILGEDRIIQFRGGSYLGAYELHFTADGITTNFGVGTNSIKLVNHPLFENFFYHVKIELNENRSKVFINGILIFNVVDDNYIFDGNENFTLNVGTGGVSTQVYYDNIKIYTEIAQVGLDVPLLKQTDPLWGSDLYDSANLWTTGDQSMSRWGCAVTSAAMVFQYNALTKMQDNSNLTPGSLNAWLKTQPDGYVRNGLLNWLALSRLSTQISQMNGVSYDALEYSRINGRDDESIKTQLVATNPQILSVPGHFVVATGEDVDNSTFFINDPFYERESLAEGYGSAYQAVGTYTPVNSDLSYIMIVVDPDIDIQMLNPTENPVGESFVEDPIVDPVGGAINSAGPVKLFYLPKPESGEYKLNLTAPTAGEYALEQYLYDEGGNVKKVTINSMLTVGKTDTYIINFDKEVSDNSSSTKLESVTFESIKKQIIDGYNQNKIKNKPTYTVLLKELEHAEGAKFEVISKAILNAMTHLIEADKKIDSTYATSLINNIRLLRDSL